MLPFVLARRIGSNLLQEHPSFPQYFFIFCRFLDILSYQTTVSDVTGRLCFIFDVYVKSREIPEHRYWPIKVGQ
jgi:hypothetical protein